MASRDVVKCCFVNIQSVGNKTIEIRELIKEFEMDIFALAETWLSSGDWARIREMTPDTHRFLHIPRSDGRVGGGVGIFISKKFSKVKQQATTLVESF